MAEDKEGFLCRDLAEAEAEADFTAVNRALENFARKTGVPTVIVIERAEEVFEKSITQDVITLLLAAGGSSLSYS